MLKQLKGAGLNVLNKKSSFALSEVFSIELKFTIDLLVKWFKQEPKSKIFEIDTLAKQKYKKENKIDPLKTNCCIWNLRLDLNSANGPHTDEITYLDFVIRKEYLLLRNLLVRDFLNEIESLKDLTSYHNNFTRSINCIRLLSEYYSINRNIENIDHECLESF